MKFSSLLMIVIISSASCAHAMKPNAKQSIRKKEITIRAPAITSIQKDRTTKKDPIIISLVDYQDLDNPTLSFSIAIPSIIDPNTELEYDPIAASVNDNNTILATIYRPTDQEKEKNDFISISQLNAALQIIRSTPIDQNNLKVECATIKNLMLTSLHTRSNLKNLINTIFQHHVEVPYNANVEECDTRGMTKTYYSFLIKKIIEQLPAEKPEQTRNLIKLLNCNYSAFSLPIHDTSCIAVSPYGQHIFITAPKKNAAGIYLITIIEQYNNNFLKKACSQISYDVCRLLCTSNYLILLGNLIKNGPYTLFMLPINSDLPTVIDHNKPPIILRKYPQKPSTLFLMNNHLICKKDENDKNFDIFKTEQ